MVSGLAGRKGKSGGLAESHLSCRGGKKAVADPFRLEDSISLEPRRNCLLAEFTSWAFEGICS